MIIDTHQHVFWLGDDDCRLIADMDRHGINVAWLLTWSPLERDNGRKTAFYRSILNPVHARENGRHDGIAPADILTARQRHPSRFIAGCCPHPAEPGAVQRFEAACDIHGVRVCGEWKFQMLFDDPRCLELFRCAGRRKCPVVLHLQDPWIPDDQGVWQLQHEWFGGTLDNLERALSACPETIFIGHAPGVWRHICGHADQDPMFRQQGSPAPGSGLLRCLEQYANFYVDLSAGSALRALRRDAGFTRDMLSRFADRFLFGRDQCGGELLQYLETLCLPLVVKQRIYRENALRLVPLTHSPPNGRARMGTPSGA